MGASHDFTFGYPLFQVVDFSMEREELQSFLQLGTAFSRQILESSVQLVDLRLAYAYRLTVAATTKNMNQASGINEAAKHTWSRPACVRSEEQRRKEKKRYETRYEYYLST